MTIWVQYTLIVDPNIPRSDQMHLIIFYDDLIKGKVSIIDMWKPKSGHRFAGYQATFFLNIKYFGYDPMVEIFTAMIAYAVASYIIAASFFTVKKEEPKSIKNIEGAVITLVALVLMFNGQALLLSMYSLIAMRLMNFAGFVLIAVFTYNYITVNSRKTPFVIRDMLGFVACVIFLLLFGRGWGAGATAAILSTLGVHFLASRDFVNPNRYPPYLVAGLFFLAYALIYFNGLVGGASVKSEFDFNRFIKFLFTKIGLAIAGLGTGASNKPETLALYLGVLYVVFTFFTSLVIIKKGKTDKASWIALFLILFSIFAGILVSINRYTESPSFVRHNIELSIGVVGVSYFVLKFLFSLKPIYNKVIAYSFATSVVLFSMNGLLSYSSYKNVQGKYHDRSEKIAASLLENPGVKAEYRKAHCVMSEKDCIRVFKIMKNYGIGPKITPSDKTN